MADLMFEQLILSYYNQTKPNFHSVSAVKMHMASTSQMASSNGQGMVTQPELRCMRLSEQEAENPPQSIKPNQEEEEFAIFQFTCISQSPCSETQQLIAHVCFSFSGHHR